MLWTRVSQQNCPVCFLRLGFSEVCFKYWGCWGPVFDSHVFLFLREKESLGKGISSLRIHGKHVIDVLICTM